MVENLLKVARSLEGWQTSRTPENVERARAAISKDWQLTVRELEAHLGIPKTMCLRFWCRIFAWNITWKNSFLASATRAEGILCCNSYWLDSNSYQWTRFPQESHNQRWIVGLWLWSRNEGPIVSVEVTWFSMPEEGMAKLQPDQDHVSCIFWLRRCCASWICSSRPNNKK